MFSPKHLILTVSYVINLYEVNYQNFENGVFFKHFSIFLHCKPFDYLQISDIKATENMHNFIYKQI